MIFSGAICSRASAEGLLGRIDDDFANAAG
jgi:hypothetical protein